MGDLDFQKFSTVQNNQMQAPTTIASAATLTVPGFLTYVTGTVVTATITPPVSGVCMIALVFTDATPPTMTTSGNISNVIVPTINQPTMMIYDPVLKKWTGFATNLT